MHNFKQVEIPPKMQQLPRDKRGYPIPYIILTDDQGTHHFVINDENKRMTCLRLGLCAVCGKLLGRDQWLIGGPLSAFHPHGAYVDTPSHYECGSYALKVCPYLAYRGYLNYQDAENVVKRVKSEDHKIFADPTMLPGKPEFFVFGKVRRIEVYQSGENGIVVKPVGDFLEIEYWRDGEHLCFSEVADRIEEIKLGKE